MTLKIDPITKSLLTILVLVVGAGLATHDVQRNDFDQSDLLESDENSQEVQEALLKLHFDAMAESRSESDGNSNDMNITMDMSKAEFQGIVGKINSEVTLLRNQALILSKAYRQLMAKHKTTLRAMDTLQVYPPNIVPDYNQHYPNEPPTSSVYSPTQPVSRIHQSPPVCQCNCMYSPPGTHRGSESNVVGNTYYYYNFLPNKDSSEVSWPVWESQSQHSSNKFPSYHHQPPPPRKPSYRPTRFDLDDPDPVDLYGPWTTKKTNSKRYKTRPIDAPTTSSFDSKFNALHNLIERVDHKTGKWKNDLQPVERLYSKSEAQALFDPVWRRSGKRTPRQLMD